MITFEDRVRIAKILETKHTLFRQFWDIGTPQVTENPGMPTACIVFDKSSGNQIGFLWNKTFWEALDDYSRAFIAGHEMLHVLLNHGKRMLDHKDDQRSNQAMDIVVNHLLVNDFGFDREKLSFDWEEFCWVDTLFEENKRPPSTKSYEYYYKLLEQINSSMSGGKSLMDVHGFSQDGDTYDQISKELSEYLTSKDFDDKLKDIINQHGEKSENKNNCPFAGNGIGQWINLNDNYKAKKNKKWEKVVSATKKKLKYDFKHFDTWIRDNNRLSDFLSDYPDTYLQTNAYMEDYYYETEFVDVWFFLDYSGSCKDYLDRFMKAANSLDENKFIVTLFTFDVQCREILDRTKIYGGGGTNFPCIEFAIQKKITEGAKYPSTVFVLTDGHGSANPFPQYPERWHWFLTEGASKSYISPECHIHRLSDFE